MEIKGKLVRWNDQRGFGFIEAQQVKGDVFIHISTLKHMVRKPQVGDVIFFSLATEQDGKHKAYNARIDGVQVKNQATLNEPAHRGKKVSMSKSPKRRSDSWFGSAIVVGLVIAFVVGKDFIDTDPEPIPIVVTPSETWIAPASTPVAPTSPKVKPRRPPQVFIEQPKFKCEGKQHCGQMISCDEAKFYLRNCPNVKIDGDSDGIPCERQWCFF